jgi:MFS family permease
MTATAHGDQRAAALTTGTLIAAAAGVCVAQVGLAIPAVLNGLFQQDLHTSSSQLTWISDAFLVPITLLELSFGVVGDLFGRKRLVLIGGLLLVIGELFAALTHGVYYLWTGQAVAGIGAAALFPTTLALIAAGTTTPRERARGISIWAAALATGAFVSPVLGGLTGTVKWGSDANAGWRWSFLAVAVLAAISVVLTAVLARDSRAPSGRSLDFPGQITIAVAMFALLFAVIQGPTSGWASPLVIGGFILAAIALIAFITAERRTAAPLLRLELFENRAFAVTAIVTVLGMFAYLGTAYATSIRMSSIQGFSPLKTSIAFVLLNAVALVGQPVTSRILERVNPRWALGAGFAFIAAGDLWMSTIPVSNFHVADIVVPLLLVGIGFALSVSSVTAVAVNTVPVNLTGMASGSTSLLRDFGFTLGPAVIGAIALSRAAAEIARKVPTLPGALLKAAGPLGLNSPAKPGGAAVQKIAFNALGHAYSLGYVVCGIAALVAAVLTLLALHGGVNEAEEVNVEGASSVVA